MSTATSDLLKAARWYHDLGLNVLPLDGKAPIGEWKPWQSERQSESDLRALPFDRATGVGLVSGIGGLVYLDFDNAGFAPVEQVLDALGYPHSYKWVVQSGSGEGYHIAFRCAGALEAEKAKITFVPSRGEAFKEVEVRIRDHQTAAPPSTHPDTGKEYTFLNGTPEDPPAEVPLEDILEAVEAVGVRKNAQQTTPARSAESDGSAAWTEDKVRSALEAIPRLPYEDWIKVITATVDALEGDLSAAERLLKETHPEEEDGEYEEKFNHLLDEVSAGSLVWYARQHGYDPFPSNLDNPPSTNGQAQESDLWGLVRNLYEEDKGEARVMAARQVIGELDVATHRKSEHVYVWDTAEKVYQEDGEQAIRTLLVEELQAKFSQHEANEILGMVRPQTYRSEFGADGYVPVANGDLKITASGVELEEATPERGFRNRSAAAWDPEAEAPTFREYLREVVPLGDDRKTLQEYAGYALMYWALPYHKALFLVGPQASGKSTFLGVIHELLGKTTRLSPQQLVDREFKAIELEDSWANVAGDIPSSLLKNVGRFKEITAGDPIFAERKYEQGYTVEPTAKHLYSANQLPEIKIDDDAFFRRVLIVAFPNTIPQENRDPSLPKRLKNELDGVLRWAVDGLTRLLENGQFSGDLPPDETRRVWDEHASSIGQFKIRALNVTGHPHDHEAKETVYRAYTEFCLERGLSTESQKQLTNVLKRDPRIGQGHRTPEGWSTQTRCYIGVQLPESNDDLDENDENLF